MDSERTRFADLGIELDRQFKELRNGVDLSAHHLTVSQGFKAINERLDLLQAQIDALHAALRDGGGV